MSSETINEYGFTAVSRDPDVLLSGKKNIKAPSPILVKDIPFPQTALALQVQAHAQKELPPKVYNHSMRVFYYGQAIAREQFPEWKYSAETYALTCLLHDIGATPQNLRATLLSFEFWGGIYALDLIEKELKAPKEQGEAVAEAIIRHQDIGTSGKITTLGQILQLATIFDNIGSHEDLVHQETIRDVTSHFPRNKWSSCFAETINEEKSLKPWAHTTALGEEDFPNGVLNNKLMEPYD
ncbi:MAG: hypothetical protein M1824_003125 [Vezdaea acicularis]|nr:MAG: hypothetical protein M1824_003125 [Vezdaea acicularis]